MSGQCLLKECGAPAAQGVRVVGRDIALMDLVLPLGAEKGGVDEHQAGQQVSGSGGNQRRGHPAHRVTDEQRSVHVAPAPIKPWSSRAGGLSRLVRR